MSITIASRESRAVHRWGKFAFVGLATAALTIWSLPVATSTLYAFGAAAQLSPSPQWFCGWVLLLVGCVVLVRTLPPRASQLRHLLIVPPIWLAIYVGLGAAGLFHLLTSIERSLIQGELAWNLAFLVPPFLTTVFLAIPAASVESRSDSSFGSTGADLTKVEWKTFEGWLNVDAPASQDYFRHWGIAQRLVAIIAKEPASIGIAGPFGSGKSTICRWVATKLSGEAESARFVVSTHSCWAFEDSASAIHAMLSAALAKVSEHVDTFDVSSLPDAYIETIASGGEWLERLTSLLRPDHDAIGQFATLSTLLADVRLRIVFVVEDLDRNEGRNFDSEEVLGFLQQLKAFPSFSFVLSGSLRSTNQGPAIDFAKLCDHIEYMPSVSVETTASLVGLLRERCLSGDDFKHARPNEDTNPWGTEGLALNRFAELPIESEAISRLLANPRSLRHVLGRTYRAWGELYGEVSWDHLLAVSSLRFAAPPAFSFVLRNWVRFRESPEPDDYPKAEPIRASLKAEWDAICSTADWDYRAARTLVTYILPGSDPWIDGAAKSAPNVLQGVHREIYWRRIVSETLSDGVRDQRVIADILSWNDSSAGAALIAGLTSSVVYGETWARFAPKFMTRTLEAKLRLGSELIWHLLRTHCESAASRNLGYDRVGSWIKDGFDPSDRAVEWLISLIADAGCVSLQLAGNLWLDFAAGVYRLIPDAARDNVRERSIEVLREHLQHAERLSAVLTIDYPKALLGFVVAKRDQTNWRNIDNWHWIAAPLLSCLETKNMAVAVNVCNLVTFNMASEKPVGSVERFPSLRRLFGAAAPNVSLLLGELSSTAPPDQRQLFCEVACISSAEANAGF